MYACMFMHICEYIYISKTRNLFLNELYFGFFQNQDFEFFKVWKKLKYNPFRNKCVILGIYFCRWQKCLWIYMYIYA